MEGQPVKQRLGNIIKVVVGLLISHQGNIMVSITSNKEQYLMTSLL